ncbi:hypothetical protein BST81_15815 [Leptolyngbya sp. 'hensonii']|nr:hypothetical protein BST81_15815 [Leptolyngbya sp. 'hensonii']
MGTLVVSNGRADAFTFGATWDANCVGNPSPDSCSLQKLLDSQGITVDTTNPTPVELFGPGASTGKVLFSVAQNAPKNKFGVYDPTTLALTQLIAGTPNSPNLLPGIYTFAYESASQFGFYLGADDQIFYSQSALNSGQKQQFLAYKLSSSTATKQDYAIAFEDLEINKASDSDFNDFVALVSIQTTAVPEPAVVGSLGLMAGMLTLTRRRRRSIEG